MNEVASGGAVVVLALIPAAMLINRSLRARRLAGKPAGRAVPLAALASAALLAAGLVLAAARGVFG
jgi:hypothetical protein